MSASPQLRLWVFTNEFEPHIIGGLGTAATNLTRSLSARGVQTLVISRSPDMRLRSAAARNLRVIRIPGHAHYYTPSVRQFKVVPIVRRLRQYEMPDCIHIHSLEFLKLADYYRKRYNIPVVYTCHSLVSPTGTGRESQLRRNNQRSLVQLANHIVVPSYWELGELKKRFSVHAYKATVIPHGVKQGSVPSRGPDHHLLFVGRLTPVKGIEELLHAIALLKSKNRQVRLYVAGAGSPTYVSSLKTLSRQLGIAAHIRWLGFQNQQQIQRLYRTCGAVVMPSRQESFGLVALEALASGIPLVATRSGGLAEFVNSHVAQVIPHVSGMSIATAIQQMWENRSAARRRAVAGQNLIARYSWPQAARQYYDLFVGT